MSLLHCACTRAQTSDSPTAKPFERSSYAPLQTVEVDSQKPELSSTDSTSSTMVDFETDASQYQLFSVIGKNHNETAFIYCAKHIPSNRSVAVKITDLEAENLLYNELEAETVLNRLLSADNILPHYCSFIHKQELWTVMPLMGYGSCHDLMSAYFGTGLPESAVAYLLRDVLQALEYLHSCGIIHRSVKASHVLISATGKVCLSGLHLAVPTIRNGVRTRIVHEYPESAFTCLQWLSPEILEQDLSGYNSYSDIYSLGILACELANGQVPFADMPVTQMLLEKLNGTKPLLADSVTYKHFVQAEIDSAEQRPENPIFQRTLSPHFHSFVSQCLEKDPKQRPSATALLSHPFLKNLRKRSSEALPDLLKPVTPLSGFEKTQKNSSNDMEEVSDHMADISMEEGWEF